MSGFTDLRLNHVGGQADESFWPSFTDIMMVVVMIFLITSATLILRNSELMQQLTESEEAKQLATKLIEGSLAENATLEERLEATQHQLAMSRLQQLQTMEEKFDLKGQLTTAQEKIAALTLTRESLETQLVASQARAATLEKQLAASQARGATLETQLATSQARGATLETQLAASQARGATLEKQLAASQARGATLETQLAESQTRNETANRTLAALQQQLEQSQQQFEQSQQQRLSTEGELASTLAQLESTSQSLNALQQQYNLSRGELTQMIAQLAASDTRIEQLQSASSTQIETVQLSEERLAELRNEYNELKSKYDKLVRPARSAKGKYVVSLRYTRDGDNRVITMKKPEDAAFYTVDKAAMHAELAALKQQYKNQLYIKVIIPDDSNLSYNEAWTFTNETLNRYDYYHQDSYTPIPAPQ